MHSKSVLASANDAHVQGRGQSVSEHGRRSGVNVDLTRDHCHAVEQDGLRQRNALRSAGKLGAILLQFPPWFTISRERRAYLEAARAELEGWPVAVEFRGGGWLDERNRDETFDLLRRTDSAFVCVDEPQGFRSSAPPVTAVTAELALVRFHGRNAAAWERPGQTAAQRFDHWYGEDELVEWVPRIQGVAQQAAEVHLLMNTNYQDQGIVNARRLADLLGGQTALELE